MAKRRWEKVSVGSLTDTEKRLLVESLGALPKQRFDILNSQISDVGDAVLTAATEADARAAIAAEGGSDILTDISTAGQQGAIADVSGGATVDLEARNTINAVLTALRALGLIAP